MPDLAHDLSIFRLVVDSGGFSGAARTLNVSHSTVSRRVRALEADLGFTLLNRTSRTMSLTDAGAIALDSGKQVAVTLDTLRSRLDELRGGVTGVLRVSSVVHLGPPLVQPAIESFLDEHPTAQVALALDDGPLDFTRRGLDVAVRVGLLVEGHLVATKLMDNAVCIVATPDLLRRTGHPRHPAELQHMPAVVYRSPDYDISTWAYREGDEVHTVSVEGRVTVDDGRTLLELVLAGLGVGYLPRTVAHPYLDDGRLVDLFPERELPDFEPVYMLRTPGTEPPLKVRAFERHLRERAAQLPASPR